jgi:hypothetical protein
MTWRSIAAFCLTAAATASAQTLSWPTEVFFYGDNTEFFGPYRLGETILGAQLQTYLRVAYAGKAELRLGIFGDYRFGADKTGREAKPLVSFRYQTATSLGIIGNLETRDNYDLLEPLRNPVLEFTRPMEYGVQWREDRPHLRASFFIDWQQLGTESKREVFDYGLMLRGKPTSWLGLECQLHGLHHGGQLTNDGAVSNNLVAAAGARASAELPLLGASALAGFVLRTKGAIDPDIDGKKVAGQGLYLRASIAPAKLFDAWVIWFRGKDFISHEGDHNYGSVGSDPDYYRSDRNYQELGLHREVPITSDLRLDLQARLHRIDGTFDYSYRFLLRVPFNVPFRDGTGRPQE